jgi:hypothetical protein
MTPDTFGDRKLWVILLSGAVAAFFVLKLLGCASPPPPLPPEKLDLVTACQRAIARSINTKPTCAEAQTSLNADEACHVLFPHGLNLDCPEYRQ